MMTIRVNRKFDLETALNLHVILLNAKVSASLSNILGHIKKKTNKLGNTIQLT